MLAADLMAADLTVVVVMDGDSMAVDTMGIADTVSVAGLDMVVSFTTLVSTTAFTGPALALV